MKHRSILLSALAVALVLTAFAAGTAYATTGCFNDTNGYWAETFICWMKDNGLSSGYADGGYHPNANVTRAEMAVFLKAQANIPPSQGQILVSAGMGNWRPFSSTDNLTFDYYSNSTTINKATTGDNFISIHPDMTTVLYGRSLNLIGVEFCYNASTSASLDYVEINTIQHSTGTGTRTIRFSDSTKRTDEACRLYTLVTPVPLTSEMGVSFFADINWTVAGASFEVGRTTFILAPTETIAAQPSAAQTIGTGPETTLSQSTESTAP